MNYIPKQQWMGCAVATAAMLSDRRYTEVAAHWPDLDEARMRCPRALCGLLEAVTDTEWTFSPCWYPLPQVHAIVPPQWPVAVWIQDVDLRPRFGQWIVITDEVVHDPGECTTHPVFSYPRRDWVVGVVVQPTRPEEFVQIHEQKRIHEDHNR